MGMMDQIREAMRMRSEAKRIEAEIKKITAEIREFCKYVPNLAVDKTLD